MYLDVRFTCRVVSYAIDQFPPRVQSSSLQPVFEYPVVLVREPRDCVILKTFQLSSTTFHLLHRSRHSKPHITIHFISIYRSTTVEIDFGQPLIRPQSSHLPLDILPRSGPLPSGTLTTCCPFDDEDAIMDDDEELDVSMEPEELLDRMFNPCSNFGPH
jgi:hypothetical protein